MRLNPGFVITVLVASLTNEAIGLEDGCEVGSDGKVVCNNCKDNHETCDFWAAEGECVANPNYMLENCQKSCQNCPGQADKAVGTSLVDEKSFLLKAIEQYGVEQTVTEDNAELPNIRDTVSYMKNFVHAEKPTHRMSKEQIFLCMNKEKLCSFWATIGECDNNPVGMVEACAPTCRLCHKIAVSQQ